MFVFLPKRALNKQTINIIYDTIRHVLDEKLVEIYIFTIVACMPAYIFMNKRSICQSYSSDSRFSLIYGVFAAIYCESNVRLNIDEYNILVVFSNAVYNMIAQRHYPVQQNFCTIVFTKLRVNC